MFKKKLELPKRDEINRDEINKAVQEYLDCGNKIKKIGTSPPENDSLLFFSKNKNKQSRKGKK